MPDEFKSDYMQITTAGTTLATAVEGGFTIVNMLQIGNVDGTNSATVDLIINKNGKGDVTFLKNLTVAAGESQVIFSDSTGKLTLEDHDVGPYSSSSSSYLPTADTIKATASNNDDLVAIISYMERTQ